MGRTLAFLLAFGALLQPQLGAARFLARTRVGARALAALARLRPDISLAELSLLLATGRQSPEDATQPSGLPNNVPDPYEVQGNLLLVNISEYITRLNNTRQRAEAQLAFVQRQEASLAAQYANNTSGLKDMISAAAEQAAKAETAVTLERLNRIHYDQASVLDRSARFWEERIAAEKELTRQAEANKRLEEFLNNSSPLLAAQRTATLVDIEKAEKANLDEWVEQYRRQLEAERQGVIDDARRRGDGQAAGDLALVLNRTLQEILKQSGV